MVKLTVRRVGNSLGVTLPAQAAQALHVKEGDRLYLTEAPGGFRLTPYDPEFSKMMDLAGFLRSRSSFALYGTRFLFSPEAEEDIPQTTPRDPCRKPAPDVPAARDRR